MGQGDTSPNIWTGGHYHYQGSVPGPRWGTSVPDPLLCPPTMQTDRPPMLLDIDRVKVNQHVRCLGQRLVTSKVIVRTQRHTHQTDCSTWTTKMVGKKN